MGALHAFMCGAPDKASARAVGITWPVGVTCTRGHQNFGTWLAMALYDSIYA